MRGAAGDQVREIRPSGLGGQVADEILGRPAQRMREQETGFKARIVDTRAGENASAVSQCFGDCVLATPIMWMDSLLQGASLVQ
jgi:hypothetical protein